MADSSPGTKFGGVPHGKWWQKGGWNRDGVYGNDVTMWFIMS